MTEAAKVHAETHACLQSSIAAGHYVEAALTTRHRSHLTVGGVL